MSSLQYISSDYRQNTLAYIKRLDIQSKEVMELSKELPIPISQRLELQHTWRVTRQKLAYFRKELERADDAFRQELELLHNALLPEIISCQVKLSDRLIRKFCKDECATERWSSIWLQVQP